MRAAGQVLLWVSLVVGALSGASAYLVFIDDASEEELAALAQQALTLNAPAGVRMVDGKLGDEPLLKARDPLTAEALSMLRENDAALALLEADAVHADRPVPRNRTVRVREFDLARWRHRWVFVLAFCGMVAGSLMIRVHAARARAGARKSEREGGAAEELAGMARDVRALVAYVEGAWQDDVRRQAIIARIGQLQRTRMAAFVEARAEFTACRGFAGMAAIMERFSAAELQLNRAWSAATDNAVEEAVACLREGSRRLDDLCEDVVKSA